MVSIRHLLAGPDEERANPTGTQDLSRTLLATQGARTRRLDDIIRQKAQPESAREKWEADQYRDALLRQKSLEEFYLDDREYRSFDPETQRILTARVAEVLDRYGHFDPNRQRGQNIITRVAAPTGYGDYDNSLVSYQSASGYGVGDSRIDPFMHEEIMDVLVPAFDEKPTVGERIETGLERMNESTVNRLNSIQDAMVAPFKRDLRKIGEEARELWQGFMRRMADLSDPAHGYQRQPRRGERYYPR